jgi:hypothetical protein
MIRHNLRRVRMLPLDESLHCSEHGLLNAEETAEVIARAGLTNAHDASVRDSRLRWWGRAIDWIASRVPARCETVR